MNKEKALKKVQRRKTNQMDEMGLEIFLESGYGTIAGAVICLVLICIKAFYNQPIQDVFSVYCFIFCGQNMYKWLPQKEKLALFSGIIWGLVAIFLFIVYISKIS